MEVTDQEVNQIIESLKGSCQPICYWQEANRIIENK
mgnify:CR=1 FL=1